MILAVDVDYREDGSALAAGVLFAGWRASEADRIVLRRIETVQPYRPGHFFERELPCIEAVLADVGPPEIIVVDGYVWLGTEGRPGLGARLHEAVGIPVIGVAKTAFAGVPADAEILRGTSSKPLYVTAAGIEADRAKAFIRSMHGPHRIPTMLTLADRACREG